MSCLIFGDFCNFIKCFIQVIANQKLNYIYLTRKAIKYALMCTFTLFQLMCTVDDLKEMGIPLGPRKKIANFVKDRAAKQVNAFFRSEIKSG